MRHAIKPLRFNLRTILAAITLIAVGLGIVGAPYYKQRRLIVELWERDVYVATEPVGPKWLQLLDSQRLFVRPVQALVLIQIVNGRTVRIRGANTTLPETKHELLQLRDDLQQELGLTGFYDGRGFRRTGGRPGIWCAVESRDGIERVSNALRHWQIPPRRAVGRGALEHLIGRGLPGKAP